MNGGLDEQCQAADRRTVKLCHCFLVIQDLFGGQTEIKTQKQPFQKAEQSGPLLLSSPSWWDQTGRLEDTTSRGPPAGSQPSLSQWSAQESGKFNVSRAGLPCSPLATSWSGGLPRVCWQETGQFSIRISSSVMDLRGIFPS